MRQQKRLTWLTAGYGQAAIIFPIVVVAARYFRGQILLGGPMQTASAFGQVQDSLSFIISSYTDIAAWRAVVERRAGFKGALKVAHIQAARKGGIHHSDGNGRELIVDDLGLDLPSGQPLIAEVNLSLARGGAHWCPGPRVWARAPSFVPLPESGPLGAAKSACRQIDVFSSCISLICQSRKPWWATLESNQPVLA